MSIEKIITHESDALLRLMEQFKCRDNLKNIIDIYTPFIQELEDELWTLLNALNCEAMEGQFLDYIGEIVGQEREPGQTDERYRQLIKAKVGINVSEGTPTRSILSVFKILTQSEWVHIIDHLNGNVTLTGTVEYTDQQIINELFEDMDKVLAAGVRMPYFVCADPELAFAFDGIGPPALGFDDGSATVGGKFAVEYTKQLDFAFDGPDLADGFGAGTADPFVGGVFI